MRVLLTGGAGYIGSHTAVELIARGDDVVIVDNFANSSPEVLNRIQQITGTTPELIECDLAERGKALELLSRERFDAVVHFAGLKAVGESVTNPLEYYRVNIDSSLTVLQLIAQTDARKLVFSSSATVYGQPQTDRISEQHPTGAGITNPYGQTKYVIEQIITDFAATQPQLTAINLRYFNPVGAHESGLIGEDPVGVPNNLMPYLLQVAAGRREKLSVFGDDYDTVDGSGVRDYIHVVDLARGHVAALNSDHPGVTAVNLGTGVGISVLQAISTFEQTTGVSVPFEITERRPGDVASVIADPTLAESLLNWRAENSFEDACRDGWRWQSQNPQGYVAA